MRGTDQPGEHPRRGVLGGQPALGERGGELGAADGEPIVEAERLHQADAGTCTVDRPDDRLGDRGRIRLRATVGGVPAATADAVEDIGVETWTERVARAGHDDHPDAVVRSRPIEAGVELVLEGDRPHVPPVGPAPGQDHDTLVVDVVLDRGRDARVAGRLTHRAPPTDARSPGTSTALPDGNSGVRFSTNDATPSAESGCRPIQRNSSHSRWKAASRSVSASIS